MNAIVSTHTPIVYVECDLAPGQTLAEWRRARAASRRAARRRSRFRILRSRT